MKNNKYGDFRRQTRDIVYEKTWSWLQRGNLNGENKLLSIAALNNTIKTNYVNIRMKYIRTESVGYVKRQMERDKTKQ